MCGDVHGCERVCAGVCECVWVCTVVCGGAWGCMDVHRYVWDEFSEYLLETRVLTTADFNTYPIRNFFTKKLSY